MCWNSVVGRDSVRAGRCRDRMPVVARISTPHHTDPVPTQPQTSWGTWLFQRVKGAGHSVNHPSPSTIQSKTVSVLLLWVFMASILFADIFQICGIHTRWLTQEWKLVLAILLIYGRSLLTTMKVNLMFLWPCIIVKTYFNNQLNAEQSALIRHTVQPFTESDDTRCCDNTICPLEDGHVNARNMSRIVT
jgi:hypothetical protein